MTGIAGLLLAAGTSTRMGMPKQLLPAGGQSLLDRVLGQALQSDLDLVALVLGFKALEIMEELSIDARHPKLRIIENRNYKKGISTSIVEGLSAVEEVYDHVMVILADMPHVTSKLINHLILRYRESRLPLGAIVTGKGRSHPVIISRSFYEEIHHLRGDAGARDLFLKHAKEVCYVEPEEPYRDVDIDTMEDYLKFKKSLDEESAGPLSS